MTLLSRIVQDKCAAAAERLPYAESHFVRLAEERNSVDPARPFARRLQRSDRLSVIAEFKRQSPSAGVFPVSDPQLVATAYAENGAQALSILTDTPDFAGSLADLVSARSAVLLPVLRKDFLVRPFELFESRAHGADCALLIVAALDRGQAAPLAEMLAAAQACSIETLVEVHDRQELDHALLCGAKTIGINHRNLHTLAIDLSLSSELKKWIPEDHCVVAESGLKSANELTRVLHSGIDAVLIGESLLKTGQPGAALSELIAPLGNHG